MLTISHVGAPKKRAVSRRLIAIRSLRIRRESAFRRTGQKCCLPLIGGKPVLQGPVFFMKSDENGDLPGKSCKHAFIQRNYSLSFRHRAHQIMESQKLPNSGDSLGTVSRLISCARAGDSRAAAELFPLIYAELRNLARQRMANERPGHTLQATALVHEVYLKLLGSQSSPGASRKQFFFAAAEAMRQILIDHARARGGLKRGGGGKAGA